jgi:putative ABC transport system permease protein
VVLYAAIQATQDERIAEGAILRTLGASHRQLWLGLATEFATLGLLAGALAASAASLVGYLLATQVLNVSYHFNPWMWPIGMVGGALGIGAAGILGMRSVFQTPPLHVLRRL